MTVNTTASFDLDTLKRGYEEWDVDALLGLYSDDVEVIQIDRDNPTSAPRVRHGKTCSRACGSTARAQASRRPSRTPWSERSARRQP